VRIKVDLDTRGIRVATARERAGAARGVANAVEHLLGLAQDVVPVQEGILKGTGATDTADLEGTVSFDTEYAARQHEETTWRHDPGRQAKYLEEPLATHRMELRDIIAAGIRRELR
jgi:hypothetical protein